MPELDHLLWATPDLDGGITIIEASTGVRPAVGGSHPGFGTRNALLSLGAAYLELIAPDPTQDLIGNRGGRVAALSGPGLLTFAVRTSDLAGYAAAARAAGCSAGAPVAMSRTRPDGLRLSWSVQHAQHELYEDLIPFAIDWQGSPHPASTAPSGCTLVDFAVLHPHPGPLAALYGCLGVAVEVRQAPWPGLTATLDTPAGILVLASM